MTLTITVVLCSWIDNNKYSMNIIHVQIHLNNSVEKNTSQKDHEITQC